MTQYYKIIDGNFNTIGAVSQDSVARFCSNSKAGFQDILNAWILSTEGTFRNEAGAASLLFASLARRNAFARLAQTAVGVNLDVLESNVPDPLEYDVIFHNDENHYVIGAEEQDYGLTVLTLQTVTAWHETWDDVEEDITVEALNMELVIEACVALTYDTPATAPIQGAKVGEVRSSELRASDIAAVRTAGQPVAQSTGGVQIAAGFFGTPPETANDLVAAARSKLANFVGNGR